MDHFPNRNAVKEAIEEQGGKVTGTVTSKTSYLINNDTASSSSKNKKAKALGVPIISEEEFLEMLNPLQEPEKIKVNLVNDRLMGVK